MQINTQRSRVVAALGPTNTGKTYLAFERMLGYGSGMIGFPLRLLARENYDRAVAIKGTRQVALITGEEKIIPPYAKYFFCTVESMPINKAVDFLAVDEIQMCSDPNRGHIFTDRLLHARGQEETMFMGAEAINFLLKQLVPEVQITYRRRFSSLTYSGSRKFVRLPSRSAVVGFTANDVYAIAELIRRQRGGAAIVMGALSPRTRNAQVDLFQNGDVDYLVATDAIGMGLNMDVDHVAFASVRKFDGTLRRKLRSDELAQIAGRAGRYMRDGTFGVTGDAEELDPLVVEAIEAHEFEPLQFVYWRNRSLDVSDLGTLLSSLNRAPDRYGLAKVREPDDERFLKELASDPEICASARGRHAVQLIWEVCQVPNFKKNLGGDHTRLLAQLYKHLRTSDHLPIEWVADQVARLDRTDDGIDALVDRIAGIRIWTYISHHGGWLEDTAHWQGRTREVEDKLSDALHQRLTQRFVDQRAATLIKRLKNRQLLQAVVSAEGDVLVEGHFVGTLNGFRFVADATDSEVAGKAVTTAAFKALGREIIRRAHMLITDTDDAFSISDGGRLIWRGNDIARLVKGGHPLIPNFIMNCEELLEQPVAHKIKKRLKEWLKNHIGFVLKPLLKIRNAPLVGAVRGISFQLVQGLGVLSKNAAGRQLKVLTEKDYRALRRLGVKIGRQDIYIPALLKPKAAALAALLWAVFQELGKIPSPPPPGRVSLPVDAALPFEFCRVAGFRQTGPLLLRVDILERLLGLIRRRASEGAFAVDAELLNLAGCTSVEMEGVFIALGCNVNVRNGETLYNKSLRRKGQKQRHGVKRMQQVNSFDGASPFAKLKDLTVGS